MNLWFLPVIALLTNVALTETKSSVYIVERDAICVVLKEWTENNIEMKRKVLNDELTYLSWRQFVALQQPEEYRKLLEECSKK